MKDQVKIDDQRPADLPEVWLRGPLPEVPPLLMPVAHVLRQVEEDIEHAARGLSVEELHRSLYGAASPAYHLRHLAGSIDRLRTYARGDALNSEQLARLDAEKQEGTENLETLVASVRHEIGRVLQQLISTTPEEMLQPRKVGRKGLPSTTIGLHFHLAEHAARHTGQFITTVKVLKADRTRHPA